MSVSPGEGVSQHVTSTGGFAYGAIGADIHVFGDGTPIYLLENWRPTPSADPEWLRELPSRMLNARFAVVGFTGRDEELAQLRRWCGEGPRLAARWLHGPGGAGKTRLAAELASESARAGWKVVVATHGPGSVLPPPGSQDLRLDTAAGVLLIVDYADRWPYTHLTWLFSNSLLHRAGLPTRILLIGRTADVWPALRGSLANARAGTSSQPVGTLPGGDRSRMFTAARDSFARRYEIDGPDAITPPGPLDDPELGLTLALHMAALVAVDAHAAGRRPPRDMAGLTLYLLDREHTHWATLAHHTPPAVMNQVVFTAALTGAVTHQAAKTIMQRVRLPERALADHAACYPAATPDTVLEPLYPDRLAEDFLALTMPGHPADYPAQPWAPQLTTTVLADDARLSRAITFLAAATDRWPHVGHTYLYPALRRDPRLAVRAGGAALSALAAINDADIALLAAIESKFPAGARVDLDTAIAAIAVRLTGHRLAATADRAEQARLHHVLGFRLDNAGRRAEALAATRQALAIRRELFAADPPAHAPALAQSLHNLALMLGDMGRHDEALTIAAEAVREHRLLARVSRRFDVDIARSLHALSVELSRARRHEEAMAATSEAVDIHRRLVAIGEPEAELHLAQALGGLGLRLRDQGRHTEALAVTREAVAICRRLGTDDPGAFDSDLANSLTNLGLHLFALRRYEEVVTAIGQAVDIRRRLVAVNPAAIQPGLALSLGNLANGFDLLGRREEALAAAAEATEIRRRLAAADPGAFEPDLAMSLNNLSKNLADVGRHEDALAVTGEAVDIRRRLAAFDPVMFEFDLAMSLTNLANRLSRVGRLEEALTAAREAVEVRRRLAATDPAEFALSLRSLSEHLSRLGRQEEAVAASAEAAEIRRPPPTPAAPRPIAGFERPVVALAGALLAWASGTLWLHDRGLTPPGPFWYLLLVVIPPPLAVLPLWRRTSIPVRRMRVWLGFGSVLALAPGILVGPVTGLIVGTAWALTGSGAFLSGFVHGTATYGAGLVLGLQLAALAAALTTLVGNTAAVSLWMIIGTAVFGAVFGLRHGLIWGIAAAAGGAFFAAWSREMILEEMPRPTPGEARA